jgi:hypothetical protein
MMTPCVVFYEGKEASAVWRIEGLFCRLEPIFMSKAAPASEAIKTNCVSQWA